MVKLDRLLNDLSYVAGACARAWSLVSMLALAAAIQPASAQPAMPALTPLRVSPESLTFTGYRGLPSADPATISVISGGTAVNFTSATSGESWLSVSSPSGTTPATITVTADTSDRAPGTYSGSITVSSGSNPPGVITIPVTLTIPPPEMPRLEPVPTSLTFTAKAPGANPLSQLLPLIPLNQAPLPFTVTLASGTSSFLSVSPQSGAVPAVLTVTATPGGMAPGTYQSSFTITTQVQETVVQVKLIILSGEPVSLDLSPPNPQLTVQAHAKFSAATQLEIANVGGSGAQDFQLSVVDPQKTPWLTLSPGAGTVPASGPVSVQITVDPSTLGPGTYYPEVRLKFGASAPRSITVTVVVTGAPQPILKLGTAGASFMARERQGLTFTQTVPVLNLGGGLLNWTSTVVLGQEWLSATVAGAASRTAPGKLTLSVNPAFAATAPAGIYYAQVMVVSKGADNSPQLLGAVLRVAPSPSLTNPPIPILDPSGLVFKTQQGSNPGQPQLVQVFVSNAAALPFQVVAQSETGNWLSAAALSATVSTSATATVSVSVVNAAGLSADIYKGRVTVALGSEVQAVNVTLIVLPPRRVGTVAQSDDCARQSLGVTFVGGAPDGVPYFLAGPGYITVQVTDNCGKVITDPALEEMDPLNPDAQPASVLIKFGSGYPSATHMDHLTDLPGGFYSTYWTPTEESAGTRIRVKATLGNLSTTVSSGGAAAAPAVETPPQPAGTASIVSKVLPGGAGPIVARGGTLNNLNGKVGDPLAPSTVAAIFGVNLAVDDNEPRSPNVLPLSTSFKGTSVDIITLDPSGKLIKIPVRLYYVSTNQVNVQIPDGLVPQQSYDLVVSVNGAPSIPERITIAAATPGLATFTDGSVIAQHADFTLVTGNAPAAPGEVILLYLVGMGATDPVVPSGTPSPSIPLANVVLPATVMIGNNKVVPVFAGLSPFSVGLYQVNVRIPDDTPDGQIPVVVIQTSGGGGTAAPTTFRSNSGLLPVKRRP